MANNTNFVPVPESKIRVGMRVAVVDPPDEHCDHEIVFGVGVVTYKAERTEVHFDSGSGGMFPHRLICYPKPERHQ